MKRFSTRGAGAVPRPPLLCLSVLSLSLSLALGCGGGGRTGGTGGTGGGGAGGTGGAGVGMGGTGVDMGGGDVAPAVFEPLPVHVHAAKVKQLLTGLPLGADELAKLVADGPGALPGLIDGWMALPQWRERTLGFFRQAFQQTQTDIADYDEQLGRPTQPWNRIDKGLFVRAAEESFARTALALVEEGRPFTETVTTERFMLNPPLMSAYAYMDATPINDLGRPVVAELWLLRKFPGLRFERTTNPDPTTLAPRPIPASESIDPASPNFMRWYEPNPYQGASDRCAEPQVAMGAQALRFVADYLYGGRPGCGSTDSQWTAADWDGWRWVTIRRPKAGEERAVFWDLPRLRDPGTHELVLGTPRVGFMTTPAFFANWPTNLSNSYRVTTNQALIVSLGRSFDDRELTVAVNETSSDAEHVQPGTTCYACHVTLDPMRDFFRQSYSLSYFQQFDTAGVPASATFTVDGSAPAMGAGVAAFARAVAAHPRFAVAWTQKLCQFANSAPCREDDPEFQRVAAAFAASNHDWRRLVRELFASPLVTFAARTATAAATGTTISILRREALCGALEHRLGVPDLCNLTGQALPPGMATPGANQIRNRARNLAVSIPGGGYARGDEQPLQPHDPNLFFHAATENLCLLLAAQLVDAPAGKGVFTSARAGEAVDSMVTLLVGLPAGDPRRAGVVALLNEHFGEARAAGVTAREALQSTFALACAAPPAISLGL
jgi:hypothetical protein